MNTIAPTFVVSLDKELIWGSFDLMPAEKFARHNPDPRGIVRSLIGLCGSGGSSPTAVRTRRGTRAFPAWPSGPPT